MFMHSRRRSSAVTVLAIWVALLGAARHGAAQVPIEQIVVFGDSLSDTGNGFALVGSNATPPDYSLDASLIPAAPYARGGHHLTNGATWIERFARQLGLAGSVRPALASAAPFATNYAVGTARAANVGPFSLPVQVAAFLQDTGGVAPADALYVIQVGGNDLRDALLAYPLGSDAIIDAAVDSIRTSILALYAAGARNFLVWNAPDIGLMPAVRMLPPQFGVVASGLSVQFNTELAAALTGLLALPPLSEIEIAQFDAFSLIHSIVASPPQFGLTNVTEACVMPNDPPFACQNPDEYLFWDGVHPTTAVHAIIAEQAAALLGL